MNKSQESQVEKGQGNTNNLSFPKRTRSRSYVFTWNNYVLEDITYLEDLFKDTKKYVFQEELGNKKNTPHLQGCVMFKYQIEFSSIKKKLPKCHIEKCKNWKCSVEYCSDPNKRNGKVFYKNVQLSEPLIDIIESNGPLPFQNEIIELVKKDPNDREIVWIYDEKGNTGKTKLIKHLNFKYKVLFCSGKKNDIFFNVGSYLDKNNNILKCVIFTFSRSYEGHVSYDSIESIKDGLFFSGKYESKCFNFNPPHVIIMCNFKPNLECLSLDRWTIYEVKKGKLILKKINKEYRMIEDDYDDDYEDVP